MDEQTLLGGISASNTSSGWSLKSNTGKLDTSVASGARSRYTTIRGGGKETKTVSVPNNYMLEVEQLSRCIQTEEKPLVTKDFSLLAARTADRILAAAGY